MNSNEGKRENEETVFNQICDGINLYAIARKNQCSIDDLRVEERRPWDTAKAVRYIVYKKTETWVKPDVKALPVNLVHGSDLVIHDDMIIDDPLNLPMDYAKVTAKLLAKHCDQKMATMLEAYGGTVTGCQFTNGNVLYIPKKEEKTMDRTFTTEDVVTLVATVGGVTENLCRKPFNVDGTDPESLDDFTARVKHAATKLSISQACDVMVLTAISTICLPVQKSNTPSTLDFS